jgi:DNA-binding response OmpR family regulator
MRQRYDLVLCGYQSTDDAAVQLLRQVRQHDSCLPVVFLEEPAALSPRGCETVLLVEDEVSVRMASAIFLAQSGYQVLEASDGEDALRVSREHAGPIHLMITDVVMPGMGGPRLAERLAEERPEMAVLFVSGYIEDTVLPLEATSRFLQKPFSLKVLAREVRQALEASEARAMVEENSPRG